MIISTILDRMSGGATWSWGGSTRSRNGSDTPVREVLAITPSPEDHILLIGVFAGTDWKVRFANTLEAALELLYSRSFPIVLCRQDLPGCDWRDLLNIINVAPCHPYIFLVIPAAVGDNEGKAQLLGAYGVITKPFCRNRIIDVLELATAIQKSEHNRS